MVDPLNDDAPTSSAGQDNDEFDIRITYSSSDGSRNDVDSFEVSARQIDASVVEERKDEIEVCLEVIDNTNVGWFAVGSSVENRPGGDHSEFSSTEVFKKSDIPYYQDDFPNVQSHIPIGERLVPVIRDWSEGEPFRA